ncbi:MAG: hypothetical protein IJ404_03455 [Clostridia bacterium]|nr:hypothetical protein [Clostridia bacterium]
MKKILIIALATIMAVFCFSLGSSAAEPSFKVDISGATAVAVGDTVKYTVEVKDINVPSSNTDEYDSGLASVTVFIKYDTAFFDGSSVSVKMPDLPSDVWGTSLKQPSDGVIKVEVWSEPDSDGKNPTANANGILKFEISIKVKSSAVEGGGKEIYIGTDTEGGDANLDIVSNVTCGSLDVSLIKKLDKPDGLVIDKEDGYKAKWNAVENADSYEIQVYKDEEKLGKPLTATGTSYDLSTLITNNFGGEYSFTVVAKSNSDLYKDSDAATSSVCNYRGKLLTPTIALTVNKIAGTVSYKITDKNLEDTVSVYIIKIYDKDGNPVGEEISSPKTSGTITGLAFGTKYDVTVTASSSSLDNVEAGNLSSDESGKVSVTADGIVGISVTKNPTLSYTEGDTVDLSKMEITVDFAVASNVKIGKDKFSEYGITVTPKHDADAILSLNGKTITVTCGELTASEVLTLEVKKGQCEHTITTTEHEDPTCGEDGFDKVVCDCGVTVENTPIPATGNHNFGEWSWKGNSVPIEGIDGVRERTCSVCGKTEEEQITYEEYLEMMSGGTTAPPDITPDTTKPVTEPDETTAPKKHNALGGLGDLGKIFLFALIAVLIVIVIFIVGAIYVESRRNRRRRSRSRTNRAKNGQNRNNYRR